MTPCPTLHGVLPVQFCFEVTNPWVSDEGIGPLAKKMLMLMGTYARIHTPHKHTQHTYNTLTTTHSHLERFADPGTENLIRAIFWPLIAPAIHILHIFTKVFFPN